MQFVKIGYELPDFRQVEQYADARGVMALCYFGLATGASLGPRPGGVTSTRQGFFIYLQDQGYR